MIEAIEMMLLRTGDHIYGPKLDRALRTCPHRAYRP